MHSSAQPPSQNSFQPDLAGRQLGDFQLLRRLGRGAMAEVYLAEQNSLRRQVAIKVLRHEFAGDRTYVQRFHNEAMAAASLTHANIVQIHEVGQIEGIHYIAQEYVAGRNLAELIARGGPRDARVAVAIIRQTASALHRAAEQGIIHRDIKPENIMLAHNGEVKVADFGLARIQGGDGVNLTQVGVTMGTPLYMSPEQIEGKPLDPRSDIYSLGVTCYHMLTGRPPFCGETALAVAVQHLNVSPTPLADVRPDLPGGLCQVVHTMLAKKPADRYQSTRELLQDLRNLVGPESWGDGFEDWATTESLALGSARLDATAQLAELMKTGSMLAPGPVRWGRWLAGALGCLALGAGLALALRPQPLLPEIGSPQIPKRATAWQQLYHAKMVDHEAAWRSVWEYFPSNLYAANLAKQNLVRNYLWTTSQYDKALPLLDELAGAPETDLSFRSFGMAGRCIVYLLSDRQTEALNDFARLTPEMIDRLDPRTRRTLGELMSHARTALDRDAAQKLQQLKDGLATSESEVELGED